MAHRQPVRGAIVEKQQALAAASRKAHRDAQGKQPYEITERANMKRQQKQMHKQDNK